MDNFVAIDVETANNHPESICAIGAVKVSGGVITDRFYELVKPEPEYYFRHFTENIHGIDRSMTENSPTFDIVWNRLKPVIGNLPLIAHNKAFDEKCIRAARRTARFRRCSGRHRVARARNAVPAHAQGPDEPHSNPRSR